MNTFKTAVVLATLLGVGYGMHVVLNKPAEDGTASGWGESGAEPLASLNLNAFKKKTKGAQATTEAEPAVQVELPADNSVAASALANSEQQTAAAIPPATNNSSNSSQLPVAAPPPALPVEANANVMANTPAEMTPLTTLTPIGIPPTATATYPEASPAPSGIQTVSASSTAPESVTSASLSAPPAGITSAGSLSHDPFEEAWQLAETQVQNQQYVEALMSLSLTLATSQLSDEQRGRAIGLLDQLAGTVIYSTQHTLKAPYTVQAGETWESIAQATRLTPEFLSRVNQLSLHDPLQPGQVLKVVPGEFRGELNVARRELTLFVGRLYAGRFEISVGRDFPNNVSQLVVASKDGPRPYYDRQTGQVVQAGAVDNPYGNHWISLRDTNSPIDQGFGIHGTGTQVLASDTRGCIGVSEEDADDLKAILVEGSKLSVVR